MEAEEYRSSNKLKTIDKQNVSLIDVVFSWSLEDVLNDKLFKTQVKEIPRSFHSKRHYFKSFEFPLLEETRALLSSSLHATSSAPYAGVTCFERSTPYEEESVYDVVADYWRSSRGKTAYKVLPGDLCLLTDAIADDISESNVEGQTWILASVVRVHEDNNDDGVSFTVKTSNGFVKKPLFVSFLANVTTNERIWNALHKCGNMEIIKKVLLPEDDEKASLVPVEHNCCSIELASTFLSKLNESQTNAVLASLCSMQCYLKPSVELIWGPPGTGKTYVLSTLLLILSKMECKTLVCASSNVAIVGLVLSFLKLAQEPFDAESTADSPRCALQNIIFFGDEYQLEAGSEEIHLESRATRLLDALKPFEDWRHYFTSMIDLLENCTTRYALEENNTGCGKSKSFPDFVKESFISIAIPLRGFISKFCSHFPGNFMTARIFEAMVTLVDALDSYETLSFQNNQITEELPTLSLHPKEIESVPSSLDTVTLLNIKRNECVSHLTNLLRLLDELLPSVINKATMKELCLQVATLIFCTASSSYKLHSIEMRPLNFLIIDDAQELKECEFLIPSQLTGLRHAILFGDQCQPPTSVTSKFSAQAGFGRSLFERLSLTDQPKHFLDMQYRMHPFISLFPCSKFYPDLILDAPNVRKRNHFKSYLMGPLFGPYSFINISCGNEEMDDVQYSRKNMVEVAVVTKIVQNLYKAWKGLRQEVSIGVTSPYTAQVSEIQDKLGEKFNGYDGFKVKVMKTNELKSTEVDIMILSTVRSNSDGSIGLLSNQPWTNVALTRARHCLWILGNENTLSNGESIWKSITHNAKERKCFFNVEEDEELAEFVIEVKKELDQLDELLDADSFLFRNARWKVLFSNNFRKSFDKIKSSQMKKLVINLLLRLANGWRPKRRAVNIACEKPKQNLMQFKVKDLYVICSVDIVKEYGCIQVLRVWDLLPLVDIPPLVRHLDAHVFSTYSDDFLNRCNAKCIAGELEIPMSWETSHDIVCLKNSNDVREGSQLPDGTSVKTSFFEGLKASDSLSLMKFYALSSGMVSQLLSSSDGTGLELPFELTSQEMEIIHFDRSSFVLGRSGTGKTTVLVRKLFQREQLYHIASEGFHELNACTSKAVKTEDNERVEETKGNFLRQIFVTVNPRLCFAVKQHISGLKRFSCVGNTTEGGASIPFDYIDDLSQFGDIPNSFMDLPPKIYPLVITFRKFLIMLDGTVGNSFFDRFPEARNHSRGNTSRKAMALETFIRRKEVNFEKFDSSYWPHFNTELIQRLESSKAFAEIISHIKGGLKDGNLHDGNISRQDYVMQCGSRVSNLSMQERERIYDIFVKYEKKKLLNGEFDVADLVSDLHRRFKEERYDGDKLDFVYIDEVQDLTMEQIALFRYICRNIDHGFVFSGDTAQTIAKGIDFRFEDIRCLFYREFVVKSRFERIYRKGEKGLVTDMFHLSQNFRTHDGILKLAQSVTNLLYHFFPQSIDVLSPELSLIIGESPVLVEYVNGENKFASLFTNAGDGGRNLVGFGAEQVILVRDDNAKNEILNYVGKQALVLTISECKGLEFEDVMLYNFVSSSPLKKEWRVIYEYMNSQNIPFHEYTTSFPSFCEEKHRLLCSELKQLYVAITRTRQRLWIFENMDELSESVLYQYWKKLKLVEVRRLDDSLMKEIQVSSTKEEWMSRGIKFFYAHNYGSAKMCFGKAGDAFWEKWAEAAGLRADSVHISGSNSKTAHIYLERAAEIFVSIGKYEQAAQCYYELKKYERAGEIYFEKCGEHKLEEAGECFTQAGCYNRAAKAYAKGNLFSDCLDACLEGKLFDGGLNYITSWKGDSTLNNNKRRYEDEIEAIAQDFLETVARKYAKLQDFTAMMKFVKAFHSKNSMRTFLKDKRCLDELMQLEIEWGCFLNAANIAKQMGRILLEAELLEKAKHFEEASLLILFYVLAMSLWGLGRDGWPLRHFSQKEEYLNKAKTLAKNVSADFFEVVCAEEKILSDKLVPMFMLKKLLSESKRHPSVRGEIICARKILDIHFSLHCSRYVWEKNYVMFWTKDTQNIVSNDHASVETLSYFWNVWRQNIGKIFEYLENGCLEDRSIYGKFCLDYFGVKARKDPTNKEVVFDLLFADAYWAKQIKDRHLHQNHEKLVSLKADQFAYAARCYWRLEMLDVGRKVLEKFKALDIFSRHKPFPLHTKMTPLLCMFEVANFFIASGFQQGYHYKMLDFSMNNIMQMMFSMDWRQPLALDMIIMRETESFKNILDMILQRISWRSQLSYREIGDMMAIILGTSGKLHGGTYEDISLRLDGYPFWRSFIERFRNIGSNITEASSSSVFFDSRAHVSLVQEFHKALELTYSAHCVAESDCMPVNSFLYLVERLLILVFFLKGNFFSIKSSFLEWLMSQEWNENAVFDFESGLRPEFRGTLEFVACIVSELLCNERYANAWISKSKLDSKCHELLVLRLFVALCLLCLNSGKYYDLLFELLGRRNIASRLPLGFYNSIRKLKPGNVDDNVNVLSYAFRNIGNPLVVVSSGRSSAYYKTPDVIFVDLEAHQGKKKLIGIMFN